jgi:hypothetical protein
MWRSRRADCVFHLPKRGLLDAASPLRNDGLLSVWVLAYLQLVEILVSLSSSDIFFRSGHCLSIPFSRGIVLHDLQLVSEM